MTHFGHGRGAWSAQLRGGLRLLAPGLIWSALLLGLWAAGGQSSRPLPGVPAAWTWPLQAIFGPLLLAASARAGAAVACVGLPAADPRGVARAFAWGFALPLAVVEGLALAAGGLDAVRRAALVALAGAAVGGAVGLGRALPGAAPRRGPRAVVGALAAGACVALWAR